MMYLYLRRMVKCLVVLGWLLLPLASQAQLSGSYTINPKNSASSTNYQNWASAVGDLLTGTRTDGGTAQGAGVSGAVTFTVYDTVYNTQISLSAITGASASNTITFKSAGGDSSKCVVSYASSTSSANDYVLQLNGVNYVTFRDIGFERTGTNSYATVVNVTNSSDNNTFESCLFKGMKIPSSSTLGFQYGTASCVYFTGNGDNIVFTGNRFLYGYNGIYNANTGSNLLVENNIFDTSGSSGVYSTGQTNLILRGNTFNMGDFGPNKGHYVSYAMRIETSPSLVIEKNRIYMTAVNCQVVRAVIVANTTSTSSSPALVANNFMYVSAGTGNSTGLATYGSSYIDFSYNNVLMTSTVSNSAAFWLYDQTWTTTHISLWNNNLIHKGYGYAYYNDGTNSGTAMDSVNHNNIYTNGTYVARWGGTTTYTNLAAWRTGTGHDSRGISVDPGYISNFDLHVSNISLNGAAKPRGNVSSDFDGQPRNNTNPDIGADEFTPLTNDAGISALDSPAYFCAGTHSVLARFANYGADTIKSLEIHWSVNGVAQTTYNWSGSVSSGNNSSAFSLGNFTFAAGTPYTFKIWTEKPNSQTDAKGTNDTLTVVRRTGLSGTYTIGGTSPNYNSFNDAINEMNSLGICGPITFNVRDGIYTEQIGLAQLRGMGKDNPITFQSQSGDSSRAVISLSSTTANGTNNAAIQMNGADWVTFKGITFMRTGTNAYSMVLEMKNGAHNNTFTNCQFIGTIRTSYLYDANVITSTNTQDSGNVFRNNLLKHGNRGFEWLGRPGAHERGTIIENNIIDSTFSSSIMVWANDGVKIRNNRVTNVRGDNTNTEYGIYMDSCAGAVEVTGNRLNMFSDEYGIYALNCVASSTNPGWIANNFIIMDGAGTNSAGSLHTAIELASCKYINVVHNNTRLFGTSTAPMVMYVNGGSNNNLYNNIFFTEVPGYALRINGSTQIDSSNFNVIYSKSNTPIRWNNTDYSSLGAYATASGQDKKSYDIDPQYFGQHDLHLYNPTLNAKAKTFAFIKTDIDGEARHATRPDIGADEFTLAANDAGISALISPNLVTCPGTQTIQVQLRNGGNDTLKSVTINWKAGGTTQTSYSWTGRLASDSTATITLGTLTTTGGSNTFFEFWTSSPNNATDGFTKNDSLKITVTTNKLPTIALGTSLPVCAGNSTRIGSAAQSGYSYSWTSNPSGFTSTTANPFVAPSANTWYILTVTETATGCTNTDSIMVQVDAVPTIDAGQDRTICAGDSTMLGSAPDTGSTYQWSSIPSGYSSTLAQPYVMPGSDIRYVLRQALKSTGCTKLDTVWVYVNTPPAAYAGGDATLCLGDSANIGTAAQNGLSYVWTSVPAGYTSQSAQNRVSPATTTQYVLTVTDTATGCIDRDTLVVTIRPQPTVDAGQDRTICAGEPVTLGSAIQLGHSYNWTSKPAGFTSLGAQPTVNPTVTTTYYLKQSMPITGCSAIDSVTITVTSAPTVQITGDRQVCAGADISYSTNTAAGNSYFWKVNGGTITIGQATPTITVHWDSTGSRSIYVIQENTSGCRDSLTVTVTVSSEATAKFVAIGTCAGRPVQFIDSSVGAQTRHFDFGDGNTSNQLNPTHVYANPGTYTVRYGVSSGGACTDTMTKVITIVNAPSPAFTATTVCAGNPTVFTNNTAGATSYLWNFGDGNTSTDQSPSHTYAAAGTYTVRLVALNGASCGDSVSSQVVVNPMPVADWTATVNFRTANFTPVDTTGDTYAWDFGDGNTSTEKKPEHRYSSGFNVYRTVKLTITKGGCSATFTDSILVGTVGLGELPQGVNKVEVYPNPFRQQTRLNVELAKAARMQAVLYDMSGKRISTLTDANYTAGAVALDIDAEALGLLPGNYLVHINVDGALVTRQIIKVE